MSGRCLAGTWPAGGALWGPRSGPLEGPGEKFLRGAPGSPRGHLVKSTVLWAPSPSGFCPVYLCLVSWRASGSARALTCSFLGFGLWSLCVCLWFVVSGTWVLLRCTHPSSRAYWLPGRPCRLRACTPTGGISAPYDSAPPTTSIPDGAPSAGCPAWGSVGAPHAIPGAALRLRRGDR